MHDKRALLLFVLLLQVVDAAFSGCDVASYYNGFDPAPYLSSGDMAGLQQALHNRIDNHVRVSYDNTRAPIEQLDQDPGHGSKVSLIYKQTSEWKSNFPNGWNKEHIWPKSLGLSTSGADYSDLFNLRASDTTMNSLRGNKYFDQCDSECVTPARVSSGESAAPSTGSGADIFQPPENERGDIARALFYMATRYDGSDVATENLKLAVCNYKCADDNNPTEGCCAANTMGNVATLVQWHLADPVDLVEIERVNSICSQYQGNRNPYVDYPELATAIFGDGSTPVGSPSPEPVSDITEPFLSGYVEGSSSNKGIRITNPTSSTFSLSGYAINSIVNAGYWASREKIFDLSPYSIPARQSICFISNQGNAALKATGCIQSSFFSFNGNDAIGIMDASGQVIDSIGIEGSLSVSSWPVCGVSGGTKDRSLERNGAHLNYQDFATSASSQHCEWDVTGQDDFSVLNNDFDFTAHAPNNYEARIIATNDAHSQQRVGLFTLLSLVILNCKLVF